jgi:hypothetical protein
MRFTALLSAVSLATLAAGAPAHLSRPTKHHPADTTIGADADAITLLQHHPKRALVDVCAALDANAMARAGLGGLLGTLLGAHADLCLCASAFPLNIEAVLGVGAGSVTNLLGLGGAARVNALLLALVRSPSVSAHSAQR